jgi:HlyD family secretion protein
VVTEDEQIVQPGTPILEIGDLGNLEIVVDLLSRDAIRVPPGAVATITGWGGPPLQARVNQIEPAAITKVSALGIEEQRVEVILSLTGDPETWRALGHGFRVLADIQVWLGNDVLSVPVGTLFRDGSDWAVFAVSNNRAALRHVTLGERNEEFAQVLGGLNDGDTVILHPGDTIAEGTKVTALANTQP